MERSPLLPISKGKIVVLVFWTILCGACKGELPLLEKFSSGNMEQKNVFLVSIDGEGKRAAQKIVREKGVTLFSSFGLKEEGPGSLWSGGDLYSKKVN